MAGYAPPPGPYLGFQPNAQPIGFEMHQPGYPPPNNGPGYPNPPAQDIYRPTTTEYPSYAKPATPSYHHHGDENADNLPPVGFEGISNHQDPETATASGVKLLESSRESPPVYPQPLGEDSHRDVEVCNMTIFNNSFHAAARSCSLWQTLSVNKWLTVLKCLQLFFLRKTVDKFKYNQHFDSLQ